MSNKLMDYSLQAIDTFEVEMIVKDKDGTKYTVGTGETTKTELTQKVDKIEVRNGISQVHRANFRTKKDNGIKITVNKFDLDIFAMKNGVKLDKESKKTIYWFVPVSVATSTATITDASRVLAIKTMNGERMTVVSGTPTEGQVKVEGNKLTFESSFTGTQVLVCYEGTTTKDNLTIVFNAKSFAKSVELICHSIIYAEETENVVADIYYDFYKAELGDDYTLSFDGGKVTDQELEFAILAPKLLPNGKVNSKNDTGAMYITEQ